MGKRLTGDSARIGSALDRRKMRAINRGVPPCFWCGYIIGHGRACPTQPTVVAKQDTGSEEKGAEKGK